MAVVHVPEGEQEEEGGEAELIVRAQGGPMSERERRGRLRLFLFMGKARAASLPFTVM